MEEEHARHTIAIDTPKLKRLPFGNIHQPQHQGKEKTQYRSRAKKAFFLTDCTKNKVRYLVQEQTSTWFEFH